MPDNENNLKAKIDGLSREVASLASRLDRLEALVSSRSHEPEESGADVLTPESVSDRPSPGAMNMGGMAALLSRLTAVTMILLFALVLRTLTDNGTIGTALGTILGILYASVLEGTGWLMYRRSHSFAPIFSVSGALLLFAVVLEAHSRFGSIPSGAAYIILVVAAAGMAIIGHMHRAGVPIIAGTVGIIIAGMLMDFPEPHFPYLAAFLLAVNVLAFSAVNLSRCWWLRIVSFLATIVAYSVWVYKLGRIQISPELPAVDYHGSWFIPAITVMTVLYLVYAFFRIPRKRGYRISRFDSVLPTLSAAWGYVLVRLYLQDQQHPFTLLGAVGAIAAAVLFIMAYVIVRKREGGATGINTLVFPAAFLLAISFRDLSGESVIALATLSVAGYGLTYFSIAWRSAGVRVTSYLLQATVMGASYILLLDNPPGSTAAVTIVSMLSISVITFLHYRRMRAYEPPHPSEFFARIDKDDRSAVVLLFGSLSSAFLALRAGAYVILGAGSAAFFCSQSVIINIGAALLFLKAYRLRKREIRNIAVLVTSIGATKVFALDLFGLKGIPLVISVLSFGVVAALGSVILGKWHRSERGIPEPLEN